MDQSSAKVKKKPVRRNNEARREQNRIASRNYREKRRQKLALLDQLLEPEDQQPAEASTAVEEPQPPVSNEDEVEEVLRGGDAIDFNSDSNSFGHVSSSPSDYILSMPYHNFELTEELMNDVLDGNAISRPQLQLGWPGGDDMSSGFINETTDISTVDSFTSSFAMMPPEPAPPTNDQNKAMFDILHGVETLSSAQKRALIRHLQQQVGDTSSYHDKTKPTITSFMTPHITGTMKADPTCLQIQARRFAAIIEAQAAASSGGFRQPSQGSTATGIFGALFANCYALGMRGVESLVVEEGWSIFTLGPEIGYHPSQLSVVRSKYRHLAADLRPCDKQHTVAHHPYLDVLPFRLFREKALMALERDPVLLDEDQLCYDLLAGGMVCWGSQQSLHGMEAAVPWDARSWEPKVWFLKKYAAYVGGWDDELWKGARRWSQLRGERIQPI